METKIQKRRHHVLATIVFSICILTILTTLALRSRFFTELFTSVKIFALFKSSLPFRSAEYENVIKSYHAEELKDKNGVVQLPENAANLTVDGRMYVTQDHLCGRMFLFVTWRGKGSNLEGYIYCPAPKGGSVAIQPGSLEIIGPTVDITGRACGKIKVEVEKTNTDGWYKVTRSID